MVKYCYNYRNEIMINISAMSETEAEGILNLKIAACEDLGVHIPGSNEFTLVSVYEIVP